MRLFFAFPTFPFLTDWFIHSDGTSINESGSIERQKIHEKEKFCAINIITLFRFSIFVYKYRVLRKTKEKVSQSQVNERQIKSFYR